MADYIERQAAIDAFNRIKNTLKNPETAHYDTLMFYEIEDVLEDVEPADVVPVVHGKWIPQKGGGLCCSECGGYALDEPDGNFIHVAVPSKFCPNCGARMDGGKED